MDNLRDQIKGESGVIQSIIDPNHSSNIQGEQKEGESGVKQSIIDELLSSNIQRYQMEGEGGITRSIIDELHSSDMVKSKVQVVLLKVSLMNFILRLTKEIKWRVKVVF